MDDIRSTCQAVLFDDLNFASSGMQEQELVKSEISPGKAKVRKITVRYIEINDLFKEYQKSEESVKVTSCGNLKIFLLHDGNI